MARSKLEMPPLPDAQIARAREWAPSESQSDEYVGLLGSSPSGADAARDGRPVVPRKPSQRPDPSICADILSRFDATSDLDGHLIEVGSVRGEVTLSGHVSNAAERDTAMKIAGRVYGVTFVHDRLQLGA